jgi:hypothetical protein
MKQRVIMALIPRRADKRHHRMTARKRSRNERPTD